MDRIAYRKDTVNKETMCNVLSNYSRLNRKHLKTQSSWFNVRYDSYDKLNDIQARDFLLTSISDDLQRLVDNKMNDDDTFVDVLFAFIEEVRPLTVDGTQAQVDAVLKIVTSRFPSEIISMYVAAVQPKLNRLYLQHLVPLLLVLPNMHPLVVERELRLFTRMAEIPQCHQDFSAFRPTRVSLYK